MAVEHWPSGQQLALQAHAPPSPQAHPDSVHTQALHVQISQHEHGDEGEENAPIANGAKALSATNEAISFFMIRNSRTKEW